MKFQVVCLGQKEIDGNHKYNDVFDYLPGTAKYVHASASNLNQAICLFSEVNFTNHSAYNEMRRAQFLAH
jgi:hypothetical protein